MTFAPPLHRNVFVAPHAANRGIALFFALLFAYYAPLLAPISAQEQSVRPGVNQAFENPDVREWVERLEKEGREVFDQREKIVEACRLRPGMSAADIGAGTGLFSRMMAARLGPQGRVYAVDIAENFVKKIEEDCRREGLNSVTGIVCKPFSVELPAASVDLVFICDTYHHFEYPQRTLSTIHRALKPAGELILIDFERIEGKSSDWVLGHVRAGREVFTAELEASGFRLSGEEKFLNESYFLRFVKNDSNGEAARK